MSATPTDSARLRTLVVFAALFLTAVVGHAVLWWLDGTRDGLGEVWLHADNQDVLLSVGGVVFDVLGVVITVVALTLELAATRYSPRIPTMFLRDRVNRAVLGGYVVVAVLVLWINLSLHRVPLPRVAMGVEVALVSLVLLSVLPYFAYVFDFVSPTRFVGRLGDQAQTSLLRGLRQGDLGVRSDLLDALTQLGETARQSADARDRAIVVAAVDALVDVGVLSVERKRGLGDPWFDAFDLLRHDEDFVSWHRSALQRVSVRRTWVELKVLRQLQAIYGDAVGEEQDIAHLIAIQVRRLAVRSAECGDAEATRLCVRFLNTFLRASINAQDVRGAYNLLNEYRLLAEALLRTSQHALCVQVARHMQVYGQLAFKARLAFVLETAAYDLCALLELAHAGDAPEHDALLDIFLTVDREPDGSGEQDAALRGVRKAQIKLATHYLVAGDDVRARRVHRDMASEDPARLRALIGELAATTDEEFWEISDRGANFDWLEPTRRDALGIYAAWVG